ncbi:MAG: Obg family GTPase CgtA, partial [Enterococcus sp.]
DMSGMEGRDPYEDYLAINKELESHNLRLLERPQIIVANKMDMPESEANLKAFKEKLQEQKADEFADDMPIFPISAVSKKGLQALLNATADLLETTPEFPLYDEEIEEDVVHYGYQSDGPEFEITREPDATWVLSGDKIEKLFQMTNFDHDETVMRFARQLRGLGVDEALRARGAKDGDIVRIGNFEFEFVE